MTAVVGLLLGLTACAAAPTPPPAPSTAGTASAAPLAPSSAAALEDACRTALVHTMEGMAPSQLQIRHCADRFATGTDDERALLACQASAPTHYVADTCFEGRPPPAAPTPSLQLGSPSDAGLLGDGDLDSTLGGTSQALGELGRRPSGSGDPIILGSLDKQLIDEGVKAGMDRVRRCYARGLASRPALAGKVVIKFVIAKDGSVSQSSVKSSTLGHPETAACIAEQFLELDFPEPKGGGIVIVSYPFLFEPG